MNKVGPDLNGHRVLLRVNPDIARALREEESAVLLDVNQSHGPETTVKPDDHLHHEQCRRDGGLIAFNGGFARTRRGGCFGGSSAAANTDTILI